MVTLLASAVITYLSNETDGRRRHFLQTWQEQLNFTSNFELESVISTEKEQLQWQLEKLPTDKLSIQNAIIILEVQFRSSFYQYQTLIACEIFSPG